MRPGSVTRSATQLAHGQRRCTACSNIWTESASRKHPSRSGLTTKGKNCCPACRAFAWIPLHARHVVEAEGFTDFGDRSRRLRLFLTHYGWARNLETFRQTVQTRVLASAHGIERSADHGDPAYQHMLAAGVADSLHAAAAQIAQDTADLVGKSQ